MNNSVQITMDDLPDELRDIAEIIGLDDVVTLMEARGGEAVYFQKLETVTKKIRNREIRRSFNGMNHRELARRYGLSVRMIRRIVDH